MEPPPTVTSPASSLLCRLALGFCAAAALVPCAHAQALPPAQTGSGSQTHGPAARPLRPAGARYSADLGDPPAVRLVDLHEDKPAANAGLALELRDPNDIPLPAQRLTLTLQASQAIPAGAQVELQTSGGSSHALIALDGPGHDAVLRDDRTLALVLPVAFTSSVQNGEQLQLRLTFPAPAPLVHVEHEPPMQLQVDAAGHETVTQTTRPELPRIASTWIQAGRFVRVPLVRRVTCPASSASPCVLEGDRLDAIASVSTSDQARQITLPQVLTSAHRLAAVPRPVNATLLLRLRTTPQALATLHTTH